MKGSEVSHQWDLKYQCNEVAKHRNVGGRRRDLITEDRFKGEPTEIMLLLAKLKNEGHSWRSLAEKINPLIDKDQQVSHALIRRVALGECKSPRIEYALGVRQEPLPMEVTPCPHCGKIHKQRKACTSYQRNGKRRLAFWLTEEEFESVRKVVDSHPGGRVKWILENSNVERNKNGEPVD
jgi:hypothetical protein